MRFLMLVCRDDRPITPSPELAEESEKWVDTMDGRGVRILGERLRPESEAKTVRVRAGEVLVTDGPFVETKEAIGGFDVIECNDLDEAIEVAAAHPIASRGLIELRPFWEWDG